MRLIDVDKLCKPIYAEDDNITGMGMTYDEMSLYNEGIDEAWSRITGAPTIDAVPVVHGRWDGSECSVCHDDLSNYMYDWPSIEFSYCPFCGAWMKNSSNRREEKTNETD